MPLLAPLFRRHPSSPLLNSPSTTTPRRRIRMLTYACTSLSPTPLISSAQSHPPPGSSYIH
eukprot:31467_5